ncbi:hypothetical protein [Nostoc sp. MS1]|nr:hypothetical protein [Nostoc sp. MS1]
MTTHTDTKYLSDRLMPFSKTQQQPQTQEILSNLALLILNWHNI